VLPAIQALKIALKKVMDHWFELIFVCDLHCLYS